MNGNLMVLLPLLGFMAGMLALGFYVRRQSAAGGFLSNYFVGGQSLGGFVLSMTMVDLQLGQFLRRRSRHGV